MTLTHRRADKKKTSPAACYRGWAWTSDGTETSCYNAWGPRSVRISSEELNLKSKISVDVRTPITLFCVLCFLFYLFAMVLVQLSRVEIALFACLHRISLALHILSCWHN